MEDNKYYCSHCDWFFKSYEVKEQTDGISDTECPNCGKPLQQDTQPYMRASDIAQWFDDYDEWSAKLAEAIDAA